MLEGVWRGEVVIKGAMKIFQAQTTLEWEIYVGKPSGKNVDRVILILGKRPLL
jgi:hypothetical protein